MASTGSFCSGVLFSGAATSAARWRYALIGNELDEALRGLPLTRAAVRVVPASGRRT